MNRLLIPILILILFACEKSNNKATPFYRYKVTRSLYSYDVWYDSVTFYYNADKQLIRVDQCYAETACGKDPVSYFIDRIEYLGGVMFLDETGHIVRYEEANSSKNFEYQGEQLVHEEYFMNDTIFQEVYYEYLQGNLVSDSTVEHLPDNGGKRAGVYHYTYSNQLSPDYLVDYTGLYEFPIKSRHLASTALSHESGVSYSYSYQVEPNRIRSIATQMNLSGSDTLGIWSTEVTFEDALASE